MNSAYCTESSYVLLNSKMSQNLGYSSGTCLYCTTATSQRKTLFEDMWDKQKIKRFGCTEINVRQYRRGDQKWTIQRNLQHRVHKTKTDKRKT